MKISIIIAVYNDPAIKQCLESIYQSKNADFETIVVDDASTSINIEKIVKDCPECKLFKLGKNGPAFARNFGAKQATGEIVFFIDSDAQLYPDTLQKISERFKNDPNLQGITIIWSDELIRANFFNRFKAIETNYLFTDVYVRSFGSNGSAIYKNLFLKEGGFDESFKSAHAEDFHMGFRFFKKGYNIVLDKNISMKHAYLDNFFFKGLKKYCKRAFLRAMVLRRTKGKMETSYNSNKFMVLYLLSGLILLSVIFGIIIRPLFWMALGLYIIFFYLNKKMYSRFLKKYGIIFAIRSVGMHYFYILIVSMAGAMGLVYACLIKNKNDI